MQSFETKFAGGKCGKRRGYPVLPCVWRAGSENEFTRPHPASMRESVVTAPIQLAGRDERALKLGLASASNFALVHGVQMRDVLARIRRDHLRDDPAVTPRRILLEAQQTGARAAC